MKRQALFIAVGVAGLIATTAVLAIVSSTRWAATTDQRLVEIDGSVAQIEADLKAAALTEQKKAQLGKLEESLKAEKKLLLERREILKQLETSGLLMYLSPPAAKAP
jgi:hypothetical protein